MAEDRIAAPPAEDRLEAPLRQAGPSKARTEPATAGRNWEVAELSRSGTPGRPGASAESRLVSSHASDSRPLWLGMVVAVFVVGGILVGIGLLNHGADAPSQAIRVQSVQ
jgi:hypothetical protein